MVTSATVHLIISAALSFSLSKIFSQAICTALPFKSAAALAAVGDVFAIR